MKRTRLLALAVVLSAFLSSTLMAQGKEESESERVAKLPKSGVLASYLTTGNTSAEMPMPWGGLDYGQGEASPLLGSISKKEGVYLIRVSNVSKEVTIEANFEFAMYNTSGSKIKTDPFTLTLRPGEKNERPATGVSGAAMALLNITSWKERDKK